MKLNVGILESLGLTNDEVKKFNNYASIDLAIKKVNALNNSFRLYYYKCGLFEKEFLLFKVPSIREDKLSTSTKGLVYKLEEKIRLKSKVEMELNNMAATLNWLYGITYSIIQSSQILGPNIISKSECREIIGRWVDSKSIDDTIDSCYRMYRKKILTYVRLFKEANNLAYLVLEKDNYVKSKGEQK